MARTIPTINTARLVLRAMRPGDFDRFAEIWAEPEVVRWITGSPRTRPESWNAFLRNAGQWQMSGFGQWAIERHGRPGIVGQVGFFTGGRGLGEDFDRFPEAGWVLEPEAQGQGLAREAVGAAHDWFDRIVTGPLTCMLHPENERSRAIAEAMGYARLRETDFEGAPSLLMIRKAPPGRPKNLLD